MAAMGETTCSRTDCTKSAKGRGLCNKHYVEVLTKERAEAGITCSVSGCDKQPRAKGLCERHYRRQRSGRPLGQDWDPNAPRGTYKNAGTRTSAEEREVARATTRPTCACGCGKLTAFDRGRIKWRPYAGKDHYRKDAPYKDAEWLRHEYEVQGRTTRDIGRECGVNSTSILNFLREHGIPVRPQSASLRLSGNVKGAKNAAWKGGTTPERQRLYKTPEWRALVRAVFERDGFRCARCKHGQDHALHALHAHHIATWAEAPERRMDLDNLVTLCRACHSWVHSNANPQREYLEERS